MKTVGAGGLFKRHFRFYRNGGIRFARFLLLEEGACGLLGIQLLAQGKQRFQDGFRAGRAAGNVNVHGNDLVHALKHGIGAEHAAGGGAGAHGDAPLGLRHLVPDAPDGQGHLVGNGAGHDHHVGLAGGKARHFGTEAGKVIPGASHGHELNGAAGKPHRHGPEGIFTNPVDGGVQGGIDKTAFRVGVQYSCFVNIRFVRGGHDNR